MPSPSQDPLYLPTAPPLDPSWLAFERESGIAAPKPAISILERQPLYAAECRALTARMTAPGARDERLGRGIAVSSFTVPSSLDAFPIPVLRYEREGPADDRKGSAILIYLHGGGLCVGEADSEELSTRRIVSDVPDISAVYSISYRLMPLHPASTCLSDCLDAFTSITSTPQPAEPTAIAPASPAAAKVLILGSSSGGELAALLAGRVGLNSGGGDNNGRNDTTPIHGLALRCPVTSDAFTSFEIYVPDRFKELHTSTRHASFANCLLGRMARAVPRDGLEYMPLEAPPEELRRMPRRAWIQVCSNDGLYSDGVCYARALEEAGGGGVDVRVDVRWGWPHTFWLKAPELEGALEAEEAMLEGIRWLLAE